MSQEKLLANNLKKNNNVGKYLTLFQRKLLQKKLHSDIPEQYRKRIQIMLLADEGKTQTEICQLLGCCPATASHWILMVRAQMAHKWQEQPLGRPKVVHEQYLSRLEEIVQKSPRELGYPFRRWTANWLSKHLAGEFGIQISDRHINRLLRQRGLSTRNNLPKTEDQKVQNYPISRIEIRDLSLTQNLESQ